MRNKTISLCDRSYEVSQKMPNFSQWVRKQILQYQPQVEVKVEVKKRVPKNVMCKNCMAIGDHFTLDCPTLEAIE